MIKRTYDANLVGIAIKTLLKTDETIDPIEWVSNPTNIVLVNDRGDMSLFEKGIKDIYTGHYYFKSRGREAVKAGKEFLDNLFNSCYNISVITGLVPITHLGARWMSRQIGLKSYGIEHVGEKPYEMFIITKKEFNS